MFSLKGICMSIMSVLCEPCFSSLISSTKLKKVNVEGLFDIIVNYTFSGLQVKRARSKGGYAGPDGTKSVFGQMASKLSSFGADSLMLPHRVWKVKFVGQCDVYHFMRVTLFWCSNI